MLEVEKRLSELGEKGCPACGNKENFSVTCSEIWLRDVYMVDGSLEWGNAEWGADVSDVYDDFINCRECDWELDLNKDNEDR